MEHLFSPCTRYRDTLGLESRGRLVAFRRRTELWKELQLDVSTEALLSAERAFTYVDLYAVSGNQNTIIWLTPHAAVGRKSKGLVQYWTQLDESYHLFSFSADGTDIIALARSPHRLSEICDVVLRLLAATVVHSLTLYREEPYYGAVINAPTLAFLMEQCSSLKLLSLHSIELDENHCRVLGTYSRHLEIKLRLCNFARAGPSALVEVLRRNHGPTELNYCRIDIFVLLDGLRGNSRLKSLTPCLYDYRGVGYQERLVIASGNPDDVNRQLFAIACTLKENTGLKSLDLSYCLLTDKTWHSICDSLKTHPTLQILSLRWPLGAAPSALTVIKSLIQALVDMLKVNISIHTIRLSEPHHSSAHELFRALVIPYLETNQLRPRVHAIQKICPIAYRAKVLGRALFAVCNDANSLWMLLSGTLEVAFLSTAGTTTPATNPPTPAIAVTASNAATAAGTFFSWCLCCC
jgi:hypothetical protein